MRADVAVVVPVQSDLVLSLEIVAASSTTVTTKRLQRHQLVLYDL